MILTIVAIGNGYSDNPNLIKSQAQRFIERGWDIKILTDKPENFDFGETFKYENKIFSYFDKMLFPLRIMEKYGSDILYIDHDFMSNISDNFIKNFKGSENFIYYEGWQKWDEKTEWWVPWTHFGDHYLEYYQPLIDYWTKIGYDYGNILTIRECFMYFPLIKEVSDIILEIEKIKPVFEYLSVVGESKFSGYGQSEGLALYKILKESNIGIERFSEPPQPRLI
jgi:hypothetical protein